MTDQNQKKRTGMASLAAAGEGEGFSVIDAIGGPRGVIESMLPGVLFVVLPDRRRHLPDMGVAES